MKLFTGYRENPPPFGNPPDQPQFEGVVFEDGTVVTKWLTEVKSMHTYADWDSFWKIGGFGTEIHWVQIGYDGPSSTLNRDDATDL